MRHRLSGIRAHGLRKGNDYPTYAPERIWHDFLHNCLKTLPQFPGRDVRSVNAVVVSPLGLLWPLHFYPLLCQDSLF